MIILVIYDINLLVTSCVQTARQLNVRLQFHWEYMKLHEHECEHLGSFS